MALLLVRQVMKIGTLAGLVSLLVHQFKLLLQSIREEERIVETKVESLDELIASGRFGNSKITNVIIKLRPYYFQPLKYTVPIRSAQRIKFEPSDNDIIYKATRKLSYEVKEGTKIEQIPNTWFAELRKPLNGRKYIKVNGFGRVQGDFFELTREFEKINRLSYWKRFRDWIITNVYALVDGGRVGSEHVGRPLLMGPVIGFLNYEVSLMKDTRILAVCDLENGEVIPKVTAVSKSEILKYFSWRVQGSYVIVGALLVSTVVLCRWLWRDIKWYLNVLKMRREKLARAYFIPEGVVGEDKMCIICYANCRNVIFFDCRHMIMCRECSENYDSEVCPYCKLEIDDVKIVKGVR